MEDRHVWGCILKQKALIKQVRSYEPYQRPTLNMACRIHLSEDFCIETAFPIQGFLSLRRFIWLVISKVGKVVLFKRPCSNQLQ